MTLTKVMVFICLVLLSGCSSLSSNLGSEHRVQNTMPPSQFGHSYSGLTLWAGTWCYLTSPNMKLPHIKYIVAPITVAMLVVDLPFTIIADTILLPFELLREPIYPRVSLANECKYSSIDLVKEAEKKKKKVIEVN